MDSIKIKVTETNVTIIAKPKKITSGNIGLLKCELDLPDAFNNLVVRVSFNGEYVTAENGKCDVPSLKEGSCQLGVYGYILDENGEYALRISPSPTYFYVSKGSFNGACKAFEKPAPAEIESVHNAIKELQNKSLAVDCKLSEESNNPIANSAVAKVLSGGKLAGIETIFDYESLMDFNFKYFDFENEVPLIADNEFVMLLVLDDIYDESGEYGDTECLIRKGMYIWTSSDAVSLGGITEDDIAALRNAVGQHNAAIQSINKQIETFATKELFEQISNVITLPDGHIRVDTYMLRGAGIYIIDCETTEIVIGSAKRHLLTMSKGEIFMVAESRNTGTYVRSVTAFTKQGIRHFPDVNADDLDTCRYLTNTETEKLVDEKLSALEIPVGSEGYRLITDVTTTEKTIYVLIDKDADDNAFDLKNVRVIIEAAAAQAQAVAVLCAADTYETSSDAIIASVNGGFFTSARISFYEIDAEEFGTLSHSTAKGDATAISTASTNVIYNSGVKSVDKIMIRTESASKLIPTGTRIQIWGY